MVKLLTRETRFKNHRSQDTVSDVVDFTEMKTTAIYLAN